MGPTQKEYYDLLQHMDDDHNQDFMKHMIGVALHAGAFLLDGESAADIVKVEGKVKATGTEVLHDWFQRSDPESSRKAKPSAFTYLTRIGPGMSLIYGHHRLALHHPGVSKKKDRKKLDDLQTHDARG